MILGAGPRITSADSVASIVTNRATSGCRPDGRMYVLLVAPLDSRVGAPGRRQDVGLPVRLCDRGGRLIAGHEGFPGPVGRDVDAIEDVPAEIEHVAIVAGRHQREELDLLRR